MTSQPAGYPLVILDLRGHGDSRAQSSPSFDEHVGDVRFLVHWLDCDAVLVGASLGGLLALQCAADAAQAGHAPGFRVATS
jgi:pimeloyl-ACP methyl ester carboxylesterase